MRDSDLELISFKRELAGCVWSFVSTLVGWMYIFSALIMASLLTPALGAIYNLSIFLPDEQLWIGSSSSFMFFGTFAVLFFFLMVATIIVLIKRS